MGLIPKHIEKVEWQLPSLDILDADRNRNESNEDSRNYDDLIDRVIGIAAKLGCISTLESLNKGARFIQIVLRPQDGTIVASDRLARAIAQEFDIEQIRVEISEKLNSRVVVEFPTEKNESVSLRQALVAQEYKDSAGKLSIPVGQTARGGFMIHDLSKAPHILSVGQTGSGKSVMTNDILVTLLLQNSPSGLRLILVDPKQVELTPYDGLPHLLKPIINEVEEAKDAVEWLIEEMGRRYEILAATNSLNIDEHNQNFNDMYHILLVIDELADLMVIDGEYFEERLVKLAQKARAVGIHMLMSTSRPSEDVVTGLLKANIPTRFGFTTASKRDSYAIIDTDGTEMLIGQGDLLYMSPLVDWKLLRLQAPFVSEDETMRIVDFWKDQSR